MILRKRLRENNDLYFVDVGANIGSYSILLADLTKNIIAIEPHPKTNLQLKMNFKLNEIDENQIYQLAIGALALYITRILAAIFQKQII